MPPPDDSSNYQMVGFDAFGDSRTERIYNSFNFFARGDSTSTVAPSSSNRRWLAIVDGSTKTVLYNQVLPDSFVELSDAEVAEILAAVNLAELPSPTEDFAAWAAARISDVDLRGENDDVDGDGLVNLLEYAYGSDPIVLDSEKGPRLEIEGGSPVLYYQRSDSALVTPFAFRGGDSPDSDTALDFSALEEVGEAVDGVIPVRVPLAAQSIFFLRLATSAL